ncbi:sulfatase family protein [Pelagibacterium halotolerans]|uniref:Choline-sulfatase n=1 Tax=Pelagibacterium halotolerans (strain DSM 22347 / JCM 15775 / CGMCC 1.7692 / B2) TaxID=1082931 RepID=G4R7E4_PELHB|nr:sulfatase-like hydrolase/transferase [Pelagibacterium halotolerans]AEQ51282.1 choline-sulfatase [Pelagibacterium halotolerans B2]QJR18862.1 sulfatase-like hydrolase/transferase [Pelagibacterium halotolerans]SEA66533.1 Arylsulfatase A [Pelagibacterium halotolerans]
MQPNILFIFPDQLRWDWIEPLTDLAVRTPNVRSLADRGTVFSNAWTPSPICAPARACMAMGTNYDRSPVRHNNHNMPAGSDTVYRRLAEAGYAVSTVGKLDLLKGFMDWGPDGQHRVNGDCRLHDLGFTRGLDNAGKHDALWARFKGVREPYMDHLASRGLDQIHIEDFKRRNDANLKVPVGETMKGGLEIPSAYGNTDLSPLPEDAYCDNWIGRNGVDELNALLAEGRPWFLTVNFAGPHEPLDVTASMRESVKDRQFPMPGRHDGLHTDLHQTVRQNYAAMVELIDGWVGRYVEILERAGALENTIIVFASDHGEMLGDHNLWAKSVPFEASVRVPLVMAGPGFEPSAAPVAAPVSLLDVMTTFLNYGACSTEGMDGYSLRPTLERGEAPERGLVFSGLGNWRAVGDGRFKLVAGFDGSLHTQQIQFAILDPAMLDAAKLYDLDNDPLEETDISEAEPAVRQRLLTALAADLEAV